MRGHVNVVVLVPAGGGRPPVNNFGCFQQGLWVCGWLRWFRLPFPRGVGPLLLGSVARWFRLFICLDYRVGFGRWRPVFGGFVSLF